MRLFDGSIVVAFIVFAIFLGMIGAAAGYPYEARLVPLVIGLPATLLAGWQLIAEIRTARHPIVPAPLAAPGSHALPADGAGRTDASSEAVAVLWLLIFTTVVLVWGLVAGGTFGVMLCQRVWLRESWGTTIKGGVLAFLILHFCFERGFRLVLFQGWLAEWIAR